MMNERLTYFSIVRYVPDPIREEQINVGIVVVSGDGSFAQARFLKYWDRVQRFGDENVQFLKDFVKSVEKRLPEQATLFLDTMLSPDQLNKFAIDWQNSIQFSEPKVSTLPADIILDKEFRRFVYMPKREYLPPEKKQTIQSAQAALGRQLDERFKDPEITKMLLKKNESIDGELDTHKFEIAIKNGYPYAAATAISFKVKDALYLHKEVDATAWAISDVRKRLSDLPLAVLITSPGSGSSNATRAQLRKATSIFRSFDVDMVKSSDISDWAFDIVKQLPQGITV